jgi:radical SAM protein with 4Fe4S-binding SPASM domain
MAVSRVRAILFEAETACTLDCSYCYNAWKAVEGYPRKGRLSTRQTIKALLKMARESGATQIACTGGEPLLRDDLPDIAASLTMKGYNVSVLTNGTRMTPEWAADLRTTGVKLVQLTLLSMDEKTHDRHCGQGAWRSIIDAHTILRKAGMPVSFTIVVTSDTVEDLPRLMTFMKKAGQKTFLLNRYNPGGRKLKDGTYRDIVLDRKQTARMLKLAQEGAARLGLVPVAAVPIPPCIVDRKAYPLVRFAGCAAATDNAYFTMDPLGNVRMCNHSPVILGNILDKPFMEIANGPASQEWIDVRPELCVPCPGWLQCKGGCRAVAQQLGLPLSTLDPYVEATTTIRPPKKKT